MTCLRPVVTIVAAIAGCALSACAADSTLQAPPRANGFNQGAAAAHIEHVLILVQENRSFDNFFATFPGADGARRGLTHTGEWIPLKPSPLGSSWVIDHNYRTFQVDYDDGKMDGFDASTKNGGNSPAGTLPYHYVDPKSIAPYFALARRYVLADRLFQTQGSGSFVAHQDLIAGDTRINASEAIVDNPTFPPWGCDAPPGTKTSVVTRAGDELVNAGPFPCFSYSTLRDTLDARGLSWKYYRPALSQQGGLLWDAFDAIRNVRYGPEWPSNVSVPQTNVFSDIAARRLAAVSWIIPDGRDSDHPGYGSDTGPSWVASIVNAVGKSSYWKSTAIFIVWDDWGGFYDHVRPPQLGYGGLGFRVPMLVVSPYAKRGYVTHTQYEFASILKFIEDIWHLPRLNESDRRANSVADAFDFTQAPRRYVPVSAKYSQAYFERRRASALVPDDE